MPGGRPSSYTPEKALEICEWISAGKSLRSFCARQGEPDQTVVYRWLRNEEEFHQQYVRARQNQSDTLVDQMLDAIDDEACRGFGPEKMANIQAVRLKIDTIKWVAGKQHPRIYGERKAVDVGGQPENPLDWATLMKKASST